MRTHTWSANVSSVSCFLALTMFVVTPSAAQTGQQSGMFGVSGSVDFLNHYMFRGVRQNITRMVVWPSLDLRVSMREGDGALQRIDVHGGSWNSLHTGDTGSGGPPGRLWYESDLYAGIGFRFARGMQASSTYTAYRSPNDMFTTVKEVSFRVSVDDGGSRPIALMPYALTAFELDTKVGAGQVDGGQKPGRYLELGVMPTYSLDRLTVAAPVKVGMSIGNYYELAGTDHPFGFASVGGQVLIPLLGSSKVGSVDVHAGVEFQRLGETTKTFNGGDASKTIASIGVGFSR